MCEESTRTGCCVVGRGRSSVGGCSCPSGIRRAGQRLDSRRYGSHPIGLHKQAARGSWGPAAGRRSCLRPAPPRLGPPRPRASELPRDDPHTLCPLRNGAGPSSHPATSDTLADAARANRGTQSTRDAQSRRTQAQGSDTTPAENPKAAGRPRRMWVGYVDGWGESSADGQR